MPSRPMSCSRTREVLWGSLDIQAETLNLLVILPKREGGLDVLQAGHTELLWHMTAVVRIANTVAHCPPLSGESDREP